MIYLIGGVPKVGKSTFASLILERDNISCISTDVIRNLLDFSPTKLGFLQLEVSKRPEVFFPYFLQFLKILQNKYPNYVVEGDIFTPSQVASIQERITLKCCFLGTSSITIEDITEKDPNPNWVNKLPPEDQAEVPEQLIQLSRVFESEASKYNFPYFNIYPDRQKSFESAYHALLS